MHRKCAANLLDTPHCQESCINHGRYCAFDSITDEFKAHFQPRQVPPSCCLWPQSAWLAPSGAVQPPLALPR